MEKTKISNQHSDDDLKRISDNLAYEISMFSEMYKVLEKDEPESPERNACLESFLIHARNLRDFFYPKSRNQDDVLTSDFIPGWEDKAGKMGAYLDANRERINKEIAHLTYTRNKETEESKKWDITKMYWFSCCQLELSV
jgi:hypothetical protein